MRKVFMVGSTVGNEVEMKSIQLESPPRFAANPDGTVTVYIFYFTAGPTTSKGWLVHFTLLDSVLQLDLYSNSKQARLYYANVPIEHLSIGVEARMKVEGTKWIPVTRDELVALKAEIALAGLLIKPLPEILTTLDDFEPVDPDKKHRLAV